MNPAASTITVSKSPEPRPINGENIDIICDAGVLIKEGATIKELAHLLGTDKNTLISALTEYDEQTGLDVIDTTHQTPWLNVQRDKNGTYQGPGMITELDRLRSIINTKSRNPTARQIGGIAVRIYGKSSDSTAIGYGPTDNHDGWLTMSEAYPPFAALPTKQFSVGQAVTTSVGIDEKSSTGEEKWITVRGTIVGPGKADGTYAVRIPGEYTNNGREVVIEIISNDLVATFGG